MDGSLWRRERGDIVSVEAKLSHIRMLVPRLRAADRREIEGAGRVPRHFLFQLVRTSHIRRTVFVSGEIAAMWGCGGAALGLVGEMWLFTTPAVERVPIGFLKTARRGITEVLQTRSRLVSEVAADYEASIRFMRMLGFTASKPYPSPGGMLYRMLELEI